MAVMHDGLPDDVASALARLEAGVATDAGPWQPRTALEAVKAWVEAAQLRRGDYLAPAMARLSATFEGHARARGWELDSLPRGQLGRCLRLLGFRLVSRGRARSILVTRDNSVALWKDVPRVLRPGRQVTRKPEAPLRPGAPRFWDALADGRRRTKAMPLVDTMGRVWPSARVASGLLRRVSHVDIQGCATGRRASAGGVLWRYLTPDEVARIPPMHVSGQPLPELAWSGTVAARHESAGCCPTCGHRPGGEG
jgi:hypothetical protein